MFDTCVHLLDMFQVPRTSAHRANACIIPLVNEHHSLRVGLPPSVPALFAALQHFPRLSERRFPLPSCPLLLSCPALTVRPHIPSISLQETDGVGTLLEVMEKNGVEKAVVCGTPVTKKWDQYEKGRPKGTFQVSE